MSIELKSGVGVASATGIGLGLGHGYSYSAIAVSLIWPMVLVTAGIFTFVGLVGWAHKNKKAAKV